MVGPTDAFLGGLQPLAGGHSGETFLADAAGEQVVVRIYGRRSADRGPLAPEVDAAVLDLVRGLLPVPEVLEVRRGDERSGMPGLLVTAKLPGVPLDQLLATLGESDQARVGTAVGVVVARLGHMVQPRPGLFADRSLDLVPLPPELRDLSLWVDRSLGRLDPSFAERLRTLADEAQDLLDEDRRSVLVHSDLNPKNLLVDPDTLEVTGLVDWEFAHSGSPWTDLGNVLRLDRDPAYVAGVLAGYRDLMPTTPDDLLERARAADLFALVELASRGAEHAVTARAAGLLAEIVRTGDLQAWPPG